MGKMKYYKTHDIATIKEMLLYNVENHKNRPAFLKKEVKGGPYVEVSFGELYDQVMALGTKLIDLGLKNSKIAIIGENCYEWMLSYFAVTCGAGIAVPIDKELSRDEMIHFLRVADCDGVIYSDAYSGYFKDEPIKIRVNMKTAEDFPREFSLNQLVADGKRLIENGFDEYVNIQIDPDEMKIILFTSGTTDSAKGVMLSNRNIISNVIATNQIVHVYPTDRTLSILPIHHTFECTIGILVPLYAGGSVAFCEGLKYIAKNLVESETTVFVAVPLILETVYGKIVKTAKKNGKYDKMMRAAAMNRRMKKLGVDLSKKLFKEVHNNFGGKLRLLVSGAAAIDPGVIRGFEDLGIQVVQGFGLTECSPLVTGTPDFCDTYGKAGSVGPAIPGTEIKIADIDEEGVGEILCKGPGVMLGYYQNEALTDLVMEDGWFHTGDLGYLDEDSFLYISGREKNVIVTKNGKNVYPEEVEYYLNKSDYIAECMVEGVYDEKEGDTKLGVQIYPDYSVIYREFGDQVSDEEILKLLKETVDNLNETMPIYKRIRRVILKKEEFVKTTTKKIKRYANQIEDDQKNSADQEGSADRDEN